MTPISLKIFENRDLVPDAWKHEAPTAQNREADERITASGFRVFNPTITRIQEGYAMAYRVVDEEHDIRRLAACHLTRDLEIIPGSIVPLSNLITFHPHAGLDPRARAWHADPRYLSLRGKLYLLWNDGGNKPMNHQFLQEMSSDGRKPIGPAREVTLKFSRTATEKNWMFFDNDEGVWAVYSIEPHIVLKVDLDDPLTVPCQLHTHVQWESDYAMTFGSLRGSAQPLASGDTFLSLAHSSYKVGLGRHYRACFYRFERHSPFRLTHAPRICFDLPNPRGETFHYPKLNPEVTEVIYPCGLVLEGETAVIAYGLNDEACAVAICALGDVERTLENPRQEFSLATKPCPEATEPAVNPPPRLQEIPLFWWNAAGARFDGVAGRRIFRTGNFGDIASRDIIERLTGAKTRPAQGNEPKLLAIGSVLHLARNGDIIWGSGAKGTRLALEPGVTDLAVHAVRGPLTADLLRRSGVSLVNLKEMFDPGCLIPVLYQEEIVRFKASQTAKPSEIRIIPHYKDDLLLRQENFRMIDQFISVDCTPLRMIEEILGAERIVSSSLHGIIFAEALGIPANWLVSVGGEDEMKFYDYYYGTGRHIVKRFTTLREALAAEPMPLPTFRFEEYLATFPRSDIEALAATGVRVGEPLVLQQYTDLELERVLERWNFALHGDRGIWATANRSRLRTQGIGTIAGEDLELLVRVTPFNHVRFQEPQRVQVTLNGRLTTIAEWERGSHASATLIFRLTGEQGVTPLDISFEARNARSPKSLGYSNIDEKQALCVSEIALHRSQMVVAKPMKAAWTVGNAKKEKKLGAETAGGE